MIDTKYRHRDLLDENNELKKRFRPEGLGMIPRSKSLLEAFEILDHFTAFEYMVQAARNEGTDEHLIHFFFERAINGMKEAMEQKTSNSIRFSSFMF